MFDMFPELLSVEQFCEAFQIGKNTAYELLNSGQVKGIKIGNVWKVPRHSMVEYVMRESKRREC